MKFEITSLGCKVNEYESQYYAQQLEEKGMEMAQEGEAADIVIINTCTVTNTAASKSRQKIRRARRENPDAFFVVTGCYAQTMEEEIRKDLDVDLLIGASRKNQLAEKVLEGLNKGVKMDLVQDLNAQDLTEFESMPIGTFEHQHRAFLKVQDGCNQYCAYCQIPLARGPERSQIPQEVIATAKSLAQAGHMEIVLTGIHTGRYHFRDTDLTDLLKQLLEETPREVCYRISSIEITEVSDALLELMKNNPRILPHLHIPIQAGCNATLARMKRPYTVEQFADRLEKIRQTIPEISVSTDVICGFVQESDEEFETTYQTLKDLHFSFLHVFPYSRRKGTAADAMEGFIHPSVAKQRTDRLLALSRELRLQDMSRFTHADVLVERKDHSMENGRTGYTSQYHPITVISEEAISGRIPVILTGIENDRLIGVPTKECKQ